MMNRDNVDPEQAERVRRIQEEIRRKIAARRGQPAQQQTPAQPLAPFNPLRPVFREEPAAPYAERVPPPLPPVPAREASAYDDSAALERQRRMAEQLAELENNRRNARRAAQALAETGAAPEPVHGGSRAVAGPAGIGARGLAADLRDPAALRRAMVLREVLGAPAALR